MILKQINKEWDLSFLAQEIGAELIGASDKKIKGVCPIDTPKEGCISFFNKKKLANIKFNLLPSAIVVNKDVVIPKGFNIPLLIVDDPMLAMIKLIEILYQPDVFFQGIDPTAKIGKDCMIDPSVNIGANVFIGDNCAIGENSTIMPNTTIYSNVAIGNNCFIHSNVAIRENCLIQDNVIIHNGAVIGSDGFGYHSINGRLLKIPQVGRVILKSGVEIGANTCIDRGALGDTVIGEHSKADNLVQIGHNVLVGRGNIMCGQVGIAGSVKTGDNVIFGGKAGVADHITIASNVRLAGGSNVGSNITDPGDYGGNPAQKASDWKKELVLIKKLPQIYANIKKLLNNTSK